MWSFEKIQGDAVLKIQTPSLSDRVLLGRECGVAAWLTEAFGVFVRKWEPIDASLRGILGWYTYARLVDMRESLWRASAEEICAYAPKVNVHAGASRNSRTLSEVGPCYGLYKAKEFRTNYAAVSENIKDLVTEQLQEYYHVKKSSSETGIIGMWLEYYAVPSI